MLDCFFFKIFFFFSKDVTIVSHGALLRIKMNFTARELFNLFCHCFVLQAANCIGQGPGNDMFENTKMIGQRLYSKAKVG